MHPKSISPSHIPWFHRARGFTAIELMVTVAILAILVALAAPSFKPLIERWRVRSAVEGLQSSLYFARSEAIKRGGNVVVERLGSDPSGCTSTGNDAWDCGWIVCADTDGNGSCAATEPVLQRFSAPVRLQITRSASDPTIGFNRWGLANNWLGFSLVPLNESTSNAAARGLCMSSAGRIRILLPEQIPCSATNN